MRNWKNNPMFRHSKGKGLPKCQFCLFFGELNRATFRCNSCVNIAHGNKDFFVPASRGGRRL